MTLLKRKKKPILYLTVDHTDPTDGGSIFDKKIIQGLLDTQICTVDVVRIPRSPSLFFPRWENKIEVGLVNTIKNLSVNKFVICAHESLFRISEYIDVDLFIVTNLFSHFSFKKNRAVELYYRFGSKRYFNSIFTLDSKWLFISHREYRLAQECFSVRVSQAEVMAPPPLPFDLGVRSCDTLHISGSGGWLPKRLSKLSRSTIEQLAAYGFHIKDFSEAQHPSFGVVEDKFLSGSKLKLAQMIYCKDVIFSLVDLSEEVDFICKDYPFYFNVVNEKELVDRLVEFRSVKSINSINRDFEKVKVLSASRSWEEFAFKIVSMLE